MSPWLVVYLVLAGAALIPGVLVTMQAWEHRRYARSRCRQRKEQPPVGKVLLLAPCKGLDEGLEENLRRLFVQDHPHYELRLIVESDHDAACAVIRRLLAEYPRVKARLIVAGVATRSGQKVHNLLAATAELPEEVDVLAFVDSDARPRPEWLRLITQRLAKPDVSATTAYRWFIPARTSLANLLLYSVNCGVAMLVGPGKHTMIWGGSWAIRRDVFEKIKLREAWHGTLSDDLVAARTLTRHECRVEFEPSCTAASPLDISMAGMNEFIRRQYTIGRCYSLGWWAGALTLSTIMQVAFLASMALAIVGAAQHADWTWMPASFTAAFYLLGSIRAWSRHSAASYYLPQWQASLRGPRLFDIALHPLAALANWRGMLQSCIGRQITWRGNTYRILPGGQIRLVQLDPLKTLPSHSPGDQRRAA